MLADVHELVIIGLVCQALLAIIAIALIRIIYILKEK